jgi:hypothetical protein
VSETPYDTHTSYLRRTTLKAFRFPPLAVHTTHTHTSYLRRTTLKAFRFPPLAVHTRHFGCFTVTDRDRPTFVKGYSCLPTCVIVSSVSFPRIIKNLCLKFPHPLQGNNKTVISCRVSSLVIWFVNFDANTFMFLEYVLSENDPCFEQNNNLIFKILKMSCVEFQTFLFFHNLSEFSSIISGCVVCCVWSVVCEVLCVKCEVWSVVCEVWSVCEVSSVMCCLWSAESEGCDGICLVS